jgi:hypothetical protein
MITTKVLMARKIKTEMVLLVVFAKKVEALVSSATLKIALNLGM